MSGFDPLPGWFLALDTLWFKVDIISGKSQDILSLPGWVVQDVQGTDDHLIIEASVIEMPLACPLCGSVKPPYRFGYRPCHIFDLPIRMRPVQIDARRRRYRCRDCAGTFLDALPGIHPQHDATERLVEYIQVPLVETTTFSSLARSIGVSEWFIRDIFTAHVEQLEQTSPRPW
jgi:transposase